MFSIIILIISFFMLIVTIGILAARSYMGEFDISEDCPLILCCLLTIGNILLVILN